MSTLNMHWMVSFHSFKVFADLWSICWANSSFALRLLYLDAVHVFFYGLWKKKSTTCSHNDNMHFSFIWQPVRLIKQGRTNQLESHTQKTIHTHFLSIWMFFSFYLYSLSMSFFISFEFFSTNRAKLNGLFLCYSADMMRWTVTIFSTFFFFLSTPHKIFLSFCPYRFYLSHLNALKSQCSLDDA